MIFLTMALPLVAIATAATAIFIGLGFLRSPSKATVWWSAGFGNVMMTSYAWVAAEVAESISIRAIGLGFMLAAAAFMWAGARSFRGENRGNLPIALSFLLVAPALLFLSSLTELYGFTFRLLFVLAGVFAGATIVELLAQRSLPRDAVMPMIVGSGVFIVFGVLIIYEGIMRWTGLSDGPDALQAMRLINLVALSVYLVLNLVTTLLLARGSGTQVALAPMTPVFDQVATDRLARAEAAGDEWWSLVDIRLDDPADLRAATSTMHFAELAERIADDVLAVLPADADVAQVDDTRFIALIPRAEGGVREVLRTLLNRISGHEQEISIPVRLSVSIGWAVVTSVGYDLGDLVAAAGEAALVAQANGGDRWERVRVEPDRVAPGAADTDRVEA